MLFWAKDMKALCGLCIEDSGRLPLSRDVVAGMALAGLVLLG